MEVLQPSQPEPISQPSTTVTQDLLDAGINLKNIQFLNHLGLKDEMFNSQVMNKIEYLAEKLPDLADLMDLDLRLGNDGQPKIDKMYAYLKLNEQSEKLREQQFLIEQQKQQLYVRR